MKCKHCGKKLGYMNIHGREFYYCDNCETKYPIKPEKPNCQYCKTHIQMIIVFAKNNDGLPNIKNPAYCPNCGRKL